MGKTQPEKPEPITVGHLIAKPHRPPTGREPRWSWVCRLMRGGVRETVWSGRGTHDEVVHALIAAFNAPRPAPALEPVEEQIETVEDLMRTWYLRAIEGVKNSQTATNYRHGGKVVSLAFGYMPLDRVTSAFLERAAVEIHARGGQKGDGLAIGTIRRSLTALQMAWSWATAERLVTIAAPKSPRLKSKRVVTDYTPSVEEVWKIIDSLPPRAHGVRDALILQLATGARIREITEIRHADVTMLERLDCDAAADVPMRGTCYGGIADAAPLDGSTCATVDLPACDGGRPDLRRHSNCTTFQPAARRAVLRLGRHTGASKTGERDVPISSPEALDVLARRFDPSRTGLDAQRRIIVGYRGQESAVYHKAIIEYLRVRVGWLALGVPRITTHGIRRCAANQYRKHGVGVARASMLLGHSPTTHMESYWDVEWDELLLSVDQASIGHRPATASNVYAIRGPR